MVLGECRSSKRSSTLARHNLLFVSNYGDGDERQISFAHFSQPETRHDLPTLKVLGWNNLDTALHLDAVARELTLNLAWPEDDSNVEAWRERWRAAFTLRNREVVTTSKELSIRLAELARSIRDRIGTALAIETEVGPLTKLMKAFQEALVHDLDADGFADMYAQTITYGLLSARIADPQKKTADDFAGHLRTNPFLRELMETFLRVGGRHGKAGGPGIDFDELGVSEVMELLDDANMEAVVRDFGDRNPLEDPVIHFYELFLKEYDARKRMQRGVFYTPRPVVSCIVRAVHEFLRMEFGLENGLADTTTWAEMEERHNDLKRPEGVPPEQDFVQILDPACGTGTFLVEAIDLIHKTLIENWQAQGHSRKVMETKWNEYVPRHLLSRLHGYELLMAPYAIAHLKIGLKLHETGYRFGSAERARVYLANALEPAHDFSGTLAYAVPALAHEAKAVNEIKRKQRFTVVIGNPPYSEKSKNDGAWINGLMERYKVTIRSEEAQIKTVSNDYVKFLRLCHHLADQAGTGVVGVITSNGYLDGRLFRDLRKSWVDRFSRISLLNLHGSGRRGDAASDDQNVFEILQGVTIVVAAICPNAKERSIRYGEVIGPRSAKYRRLIDGSIARLETSLSPAAPLFLFAPSNAARSALPTWPLSEIFGTGDPRIDRNKTYAGGFKTRQDGFTVAFDSETLLLRIADLANSSHSEAALREKYGLCTTAHFEFDEARRAAKTGTLRQAIRRIRYRPFDDRPMIWAREVLCEPQVEVTRHLLRPNLCLVTSRVVKDDAFRHVSVARGPVEVISLSASTSTNAYMFPLYRYDTGDLFAGGRVPNLSGRFVEMLSAAIGLRFAAPPTRVSEDTSFQPEDVFAYIFAVLHCPSYRRLYADELLRDFPRIPLPGSLDLFRALCVLGRGLVSLHLLESPGLDQFITTYLGPKSPVVGRPSWSEDTVWLDGAATKRGQPTGPGTIGFRGVHEAVWNFRVGGYQVCEKWLKDRKGRRLSKDDIAHYQKIVVALSKAIRLMTDIDSVIDNHGGWPGAFSATPTGDGEVVTLSGPAPAVVPQRTEPTLKVAHLPTLPFLGGERPSRSPPDCGPDPDELIGVVRHLFGDGLARERNSAIEEVAKSVRGTSSARDEAEAAIQAALERNVIHEQGHELRLAARTIEHYDRQFLGDQFVASLPGRNWVEREDAIRRFARRLGFRRTGASIEEVARSIMRSLIRARRIEPHGSAIRRTHSS